MDGEPVVPLEDICDYHEVLIVKHENERRAQRKADRDARQKGRR